MAQKAKNSWAQMSEEWAAEETGRPCRVMVIRKPVYDENMMETDSDLDLSINASFGEMKSSNAENDSHVTDDSLGELPHYSVTIRTDPRSTICYDELIPTPPPIIPREQAKRIKVHVKFDSDRNPTSIKARLGGPPQRMKREDGELFSEHDNSDEEDEKYNLDKGWTKRLIGPRMRMYADEEQEKIKNQQGLKSRLYTGSSWKYQSKLPENHLRSIQSHGSRVDKSGGHMSRSFTRDHFGEERARVSVKSRLGLRK